jgi:multidrug efflux pump subunit AcrA (membrane-fusion protein)
VRVLPIEPQGVELKGNKKEIIVLSFIIAAFAGGFIYGRWYRGAPTEPVVDAHSARKILSYTCSMHPSYKSDKPGNCPMCDMKLEPVYADDGKPAAAGASEILHISPEKQQLIGVEYGTVEYGPVSRTIRAAARVEVDETKVYHVQSKMEGWVDQVYVTVVGTQVKKNQPLLTVYNPMSLGAQYELIKHAGTGMHMGDSTTARPTRRADVPPGKDVQTGKEAQPGKDALSPRPVGGPGSSSQASDQALFEADKFRLQYMGFDDELIMTIARTGTPIYNLPIYSPADGFVIERNALPKQKMTPDTLYTIADLSTVYVTADVPEYEASAIQVGQRAELAVPSAAGRTFRGRIDSILPLADSLSHTLKVRIVMENPGYALKPGMYGDLEIQSGNARRLTVPQEAILDSGLKRIVFIDRGDGKLEPKEVSTGQTFGTRVEVLGGLQPGDRIVTSGNFLIDSESQLKGGRGTRSQ